MVLLAGLGTLVGQVSSLVGIQGKGSAGKQTGTASVSPAIVNTDTQTISSMGQMLGKLQQLQQRNPQKFRQVLTSIAANLDAAARQQAANPQAQVLSDLAGRFRQAAQSGDLSGLQSFNQLSPQQHRAHQTYARSLLGSQSTATALSTGSSNADLQKVLAAVNQQVDKALKG